MMDSVEEDPFGECITENQDTSDVQLISSNSPRVNDIFGDPQVLPRVGDQYQVGIPLLTESDHLQLLKNPTNQDCLIDVSDSFRLGLAIPIMWIHDKSDSTKNEKLDLPGAPNAVVNKTESIESENIKESNLSLKGEDSKVKIEPLEISSDNGEGVGGISSCNPTVMGSENSVDLTLSQHEKPKLEKCKGQGYFPAPGSLSSFWSYFEQESFLLGLYIFGKDLVQVKKFTGSKEMGDILSFYYGIFYRSDQYRRWSECRKIRSKKCIHGHRIFTGWRQQELLSRLLPRVSEECQNILLEVSRRFGDGKFSLAEYVSTLKANVGMNLLIEAVGIGKGKQDLTGNVSEPLKANQVIHAHHEIPVGKACASLTSGDIIRFLTGDFRLSKARANDLFWEAVWPRLLENGWHSEQPKNQIYARSKRPLVFLIPGIKKFSRRRLVKGRHYFDSVSDVLNKVASEPRLLDLEAEAHKGSIHHEEYESETKVDLKEDSHFGQRHCYLQPRVSTTSPDLMFTVVDTSLVHGDEPGTVKKLRSLPGEVTKGAAAHISRKDYGGNCEKAVLKLEFLGMLSKEQMNTESSGLSQRKSDRVVCSGLSGCAVSIPKQGMPNTGSELSTNAGIDFPKDGDGSMGDKVLDKITEYQSSRVNAPEHINAPMENKNNGNSSMLEKNPSKMIKCQFTRRRKRDQTSNSTPVTKRRSLTACSHDDATRSTNNFCIGSGVKEKELHIDLGSHNGSDSALFKDAPIHEKVSTSSSTKGNDNFDDVFYGNYSGKTSSPERNLPQTLMDLNLTNFSQDSQTSVKCATKMENSNGYQSKICSSFPSEGNHQLEDSQQLNTVNHEATAEEQPVTMTRRHGTRNRPLTTKALEALACGFLTTKRKWRGMEPMSEENMIPKPSRRARDKFSITTKFGDVTTSTVDCKEHEGLHEECSSDTIVGSGTQVLTGRVS